MSLQNMLKRAVTRNTRSEQQSLDGEMVLQSDTKGPARLGLWVLGLGFGGFLLWAGFAPLDEGVPTQGTVMIDTKRKTIQHLSGGIVREVKVGEGQLVKEGDVLIRLDAASVRANYESIHQHYMTIRAMEGRLVAEQTGASKITFHPDLLAAANNPLIKQHMSNQEMLFQSRRMAKQAEIQSIQESIQGLEASIQGYDGILKNRKIQLGLLQEELRGTRELVAEGYAPRNRQMDLERSAADVMASIFEVQANLTRSRRSVAEMKMRIVQRQQEYQKEVDTQLSDVRREVQADAEKFRAITEELTRTEIKAPVSGQVVGLAVQTVGGIIQSGQKLMDIVPKGESLLVETKVQPHMIDRVHPGLEVNVRFSAFAHTPQLVVQGKVESISSDVITEQTSMGLMSYYLARVSVTPEGIKALGHRQMQPGMPVEVVIKTGERSVLTYLLHPLTKRIAASMKEE